MVVALRRRTLLPLDDVLGSLRHALAAFPYKLHTILTDNGVAFTDGASTKHDFKVHPFNRVCRAHGIKHKPAKPYHLWTNGQAERMAA